MKIKGRQISGHNIVTLAIPRDQDEDIIFRCQAVLDMSEFDKLCPTPKPPVKILKGGKRVEDTDSPAYKATMNAYAGNRINYLILKSLEATEGLEFETIKMSDSGTWGNYQTELKSAGFSEIEVARIINSVMAANCLDDNIIEKARNDFLASQQPEPEA